MTAQPITGLGSDAILNKLCVSQLQASETMLSQHTIQSKQSL